MVNRRDRYHSIGKAPSAGLPRLAGISSPGSRKQCKCVGPRTNSALWRQNCLPNVPDSGVRNAAGHSRSFRLPTATDKFYPDFVAQLADGRLLVVEYKSALLAGAGVDDTNEKPTSAVSSNSASVSVYVPLNPMVTVPFRAMGRVTPTTRFPSDEI